MTDDPRALHIHMLAAMTRTKSLLLEVLQCIAKKTSNFINIIATYMQ